MEKRTLRKIILQKRGEISSEELQEKSKKITKQIIASEEFRTADIILLYASYNSEVDTTDILRHALATGKALYLPKVQGDKMEFYQVFEEEELQIGYHGIREPEEKLDRRFALPQDMKIQSSQKTNILMLLPGAVFDREGNRIGYGGGFYDKYLAKLESQMAGLSSVRLKKWALAFECQMVEQGQIIAESYDMRVDCIITEKNIADSDKTR